MGPLRGFAVCDEFVKRLFCCSILAHDCLCILVLRIFQTMKAIWHSGESRDIRRINVLRILNS
mgnify:CR=1 FL=1